MIKGYGTLENNRYNQNFTSVGSMQEGQQFGAASTRLVNNAADSMRPLSQDTLQVEGQPPMPAQEGMLGDLRYTLPIWFLMGKAVDFYNGKCGGAYENSLPAKLGKLGDKIATSKLLDNSFVHSATQKATQAKDFVVNRWRQNSTLLRNLMDVSTKPDMQAAAQMMHTQEQSLASEIGINLERYLRAGDGKKIKFSNLVVTPEEKEFVNRILGKGAAEIDKVNCLQLYRSNPAKFNDVTSIRALLNQRATNPTIIRETIFKELGYDLKTMEKYLAEPHKYVKELREFALKAGKKNMRVYHGNYRIGGWFFRRVADLSQSANKMISISKTPIRNAAGSVLHTPPATALGRGMSKLMQGIVHGLTFGGGKLGLLIFVAPSLYNMVMDAKEAPDKQKAATIAMGLVESVSWVAAFPMGIKLMHKLGGLRYLGMTKNQVGQYRTALEQFHADNAKGLFRTKEAYNKAWQKVKALRKPTGELNIFNKILKGAGTLFTQDLEMRQAWKNPASGTIRNALRGRSVGNFFRHLGGGAAKFAAGLFVAIPLVSKIFEKPVEWIFGKPYSRMEEAEKKAAAQQAQAQSQPQIQPQTMTQTPQGAPNQPVIDAIDNFNKQMEAAKNPQPVVTPQAQVQPQIVQQQVQPQQLFVPQQPNVQPATYIKSQQNIANENRYIPSQECGIPKDSGEFNIRTYIPGQDSQVVQTPEDLSGLDAIEMKARNAEQLAAQILGRRV